MPKIFIINIMMLTIIQHISKKQKEEQNHLHIEKKKKDKKMRTKIFMNRDSSSAINNFIIKKKSNAKSIFLGEQSGNNNTNSDYKGIGSFNHESSKQKISISRDNKK